MSFLSVEEVHSSLLSSPAPSQEACPSGQAPPLLQVTVHLSDGRQRVLRRSDEDLAWTMKKLVDGFPDDRDTLSNELLSGLLRVRAAEKSPDPEFKVQEINKLLTTIIHLPPRFSQSEPVRTFFGLDQDLCGDTDLFKTGLTEEPDPDSTKDPSDTPKEPQVQSPGPDRALVRLGSDSDVLRCNGFCLANTETIFPDQSERGEQSQWEQSRGSMGQSEHGVDRGADTSCLGHAPHCGLSNLIGRVVRGRSLKRKKASSS